MDGTPSSPLDQIIREGTRMRSDQHRCRIKNDWDDGYSHTTYTSIPDHDMTEAETSRFVTILYIWLALLIAAALIGYSLRSVRNNPSETPNPNLQQAPI
jgi:hypothetical protein